MMYLVADADVLISMSALDYLESLNNI